ncbi:MAG: alpha/beta hydrolase [Proteobacteria bacterium]|nr:alpha/beta hydrolase [Pseudomonadota bacterium]
MKAPLKRAAIAVLTGLAAVIVWLSAAYRADIAGARARVATGGRIVATPCGPIEYAEAGEGPPILIVHGAGGGFDQGLALAASFAPKGYRVIAPSRFGYLGTPAPAGASIGLQAEAHACLLDALGVPKSIVVGVSAGAPSAMEFALRYPTRCAALVLVVPGWFPARAGVPARVGPVVRAVLDWSLRSDVAYWVVARFLPSAATRTVMGTPTGVVAAASADEKARVAAMLRDILPISRRSIGLALEPTLTVEPLSRPLGEISVPTLAISAEDDLYGTWNSARYISRQVPHAQFLTFPSGGHLLVGHGEAVAAAIARFLKANAASP